MGDWNHSLAIPEEITADTLGPLLETQHLGRVVHAFGECDSTSVFARRLLESDPTPAHGTLVVTDYQRAGRGRGGRGWEAPRGRALLFSLVLYPRPGPGAADSLVTMAASVAVVRALRDAGLERCAIKWPNDVLAADGRKLCGILTEQVARTGDPRAAFITGIGINVNQERHEFAEALRARATSARIELGRAVSRLELLRRVLERFEHALELPTKLLFDAWHRSSSTIGKTVRLRLGDRVVVAQAQGLEEDGRLILRLPSGQLEVVHSGDIEELRTDDGRTEPDR